ncbi:MULTISPECIES: hypothetical protein [Labrys]|nr:MULTISPECIES: hypothetical protein [unclassified Labrys (in: a-proteobacteria)]MDZ5452397.1 hypothetical protein [Labrys sp. ZIDIC5]
MTIELWPFLVLPLAGLVAGAGIVRFVIGPDWMECLRQRREFQRR